MSSGQMSPRAIVIYCGLLMTVTAFSVDITLPAFGLIAEDLAAPYGRVQWIVPVFILFTGIGQIFVGALSDRFGRRPVILGGISIYAIGALVCFFAPSIEILLGGRAVQGVGAAAGAVVGRAIVRDMFEGNELARNLALAAMIFAFGPIIAPLLGVSIMSLGTWRLIFLVITLFGLSLIVFGWWFLPETLKTKNERATQSDVLWANAKTTLRNRQSRFYLLMAGPIQAMMIIILVAIPRVFKDAFGIEGTLFAILFALHGAGIIIGQIANRALISKLGTASAMKIGAGVLLLCTLSMLALYQAGLMHAYVMTGAMVAYATGYLVVFSNATALVLEPHGQIAGFVSSLYGFVAQVVSSLLAIGIASYIGGDLSTFIWVLVVVTGSVFTTLLLGDPDRKMQEQR